MREWDPIGVRDEPEVQDEYDSYVAEAHVMLIDRGATAADLEQYLLRIESDHMGLGERAGDQRPEFKGAVLPSVQ